MANSRNDRKGKGVGANGYKSIGWTHFHNRANQSLSWCLRSLRTLPSWPSAVDQQGRALDTPFLGPLLIIGIRFQKLTLVMGAGVGCGEDWRIWNDAK